MVNLILVDSTVLIRLVTGEQGAEFAVNLFSRVEEGVDQVIIPSTAIIEALTALSIAAISAEYGIKSVDEALEKFSDTNARSKVYEKALQLASYLAQLEYSGKVVVYNVTARDIAEALEKAKKHVLSLSDAITLVIADKLKVQKIASFSPDLRRIGEYIILPSS